MPVFPGYPASIGTTGNPSSALACSVLAQGGHQANPAEGLLMDDCGEKVESTTSAKFSQKTAYRQARLVMPFQTA